MILASRRGKAFAIAFVALLASAAVARVLLRASNMRACDTLMRVVIEGGYRPEDTAVGTAALSYSIYTHDHVSELLASAARWTSQPESLRAHATASDTTQVLLADGMTYVVFYDASGRAKDYLCVPP